MAKFDFLFARPSFLGGMAKVLDLAGTLNEYNYSPNENLADARALHLDWEAVRLDLMTAIEKYKSPHPTK
ncbi:MAG: hypothetical protein JRJ29_15025 [Deltaproteobacteria bacterium]|nr:hypothetical protein [Deltaproteobacteria bacterium]